MKRVTGIGGVFFKSNDPEKLYARYEEHLGLKPREGEAVVFKWRQADDRTEGRTVLGIFPKSTKYFDPSRSRFMLNFRVHNLDACSQLFARRVLRSMRRSRSTTTGDSPGSWTRKVTASNSGSLQNNLVAPGLSPVRADLKVGPDEVIQGGNKHTICSADPGCGTGTYRPCMRG